ncbi:MAG: ATP-binding cassette domain-containing protein [Peptococcaceae bacterium]|nr:ATP-binding cassette domain-containing protein [Peptococcaceae bacterium]
MAALKVAGLWKNIKKRNVLSDISFELAEGEIVGYIGPNGAGKTTTIKMCLGLSKVDAGEISCCDKNIHSDFCGYIKNISGVLDMPGLHNNMTALENMKMTANIFGIADKKRIIDSIEFVGLQNRGKDKVKTYSSGMKQRLNMARVFLVSPKVIMLDEPFNGIDPEGIADMRKLLRLINAERKTAVFVSSHLLSEVEKLCSRVICIKSGEIKGSIDLSDQSNVLLALFTSDNSKSENILSEKFGFEIISDQTHIRFLINSGAVEKAMESIRQHDISVYDVRTESALEQEYLDLMGGNIIA